MSMIKDGQKRVGKFFKKGHHILKTVSLLDYSFEEIRNSPVIDFDNINRSIIHTKLHEPEEVESAVQKHVSFDNSLLDPNQQNPVIFPADFTKDWQAEKVNRKRRIMGFDDEDDYDFENAQRLEFGFGVPLAQQEPVIAKVEPIVESFSEPMPPPAPAEAPPPPVEQNLSQMGKLDVMTKALKEIMETEPESKAKVTTPVDPAEFVPMNTAATGENVVEQVAPPTPTPKVVQTEELGRELETLKQEASQRGYMEGFKIGEEKGELQTKQQANQIFSKVSDLIKDMSGLKVNVLQNIQKNFYELSQAIAEALLQKEFALNPQSFANLIKRAVDETVKADTFKIRVNPQTYEQIAKTQSEIVTHMVKDSEIPVGEFRIESDLSVVDVNTKKLIKNLLDQADLDLFTQEQEPKKAS